MELSLIDRGAVVDALQDRHGLLRDEAIYRPDTLANICRHAAGLLCPINARGLRRAIVDPLEAIDFVGVRDEVRQVLDSLIDQGDLLELEEAMIGNRDRREVLVYAAPPHFVPLSDERFLILGLNPDNTPILPDSLSQRILHRGCLRVLIPANAHEMAAQLIELGVQRVDPNAWLKAPTPKSAAEHVESANQRLERSGRAGSVLNLIILDSDKPNYYYKGRWREAGTTSGRFVARRTRAYGSDLWCYIEIREGVPTRLIDFPHGRTDERGCDQAWRLQAAIDDLHERPQRLRVRRLDENYVAVDVFSPPPKWLVRRWQSVGTRIPPKRCLASFKLRPEQVDTELHFAKERMWLSTLANAEK